MVSAFFEVRDLSLELNRHSVLSDISFSLDKGKLLAVIGSNGAGKSSLLKCLGGLYRNFSGSVLLEGISLAAMPQKKIARRIAWVHQSSSDTMPYTVREFAEMSRYPWQQAFSGMSRRDRECVEEALSLADVEDIAERKLKSLSGGERQRALIAAALAQDTDVLFLDEPTSFLDYRYQVETLKLIERIDRERGITVVMVTHDVNLALRSADQILSLKNGRFFWNGTPSGFLENDLLRGVFDTEFVCFGDMDGGRPYVAPRGLVE